MFLKKPPPINKDNILLSIIIYISIFLFNINRNFLLGIRIKPFIKLRSIFPI